MWNRLLSLRTLLFICSAWMCYGMRPDHLYVLSFFFFFLLLLLGYIVVYSSLSSSLFTAIVSATTPPLPLLRCSSFACARLLFKIASPSTGDLVSIKQLWPWLLSGIHTYIYIYMGCSSSRNAIPPQLKINCYQLVLLELPDRLSDIKPTAA